MSRSFQTTRWSLVLAAGETAASESREALAGLCEAYWYPLYTFVRRQGYGPDEAADLTQGYFLTFLEKNYLADVRPEAGRFRSFLLASLKHFLSKERERARALKRGGGRNTLSIDWSGAESRFMAETIDSASPEAAFERQWARTMLDRAMKRLEGEFREAGKEQQLDCLRGHLTGEGQAARYAEIAARLGISEGAVRVVIHRSRRRFGEHLRAEIAETVARPEDIDAEVRHLLETLR